MRTAVILAECDDDDDLERGIAELLKRKKADSHGIPDRRGKHSGLRRLLSQSSFLFQFSFLRRMPKMLSPRVPCMSSLEMSKLCTTPWHLLSRTYGSGAHFLAVAPGARIAAFDGGRKNVKALTHIFSV